MFYQIFFTPQVKRCAIITYKHGIYELPHELLNELRLRKFFPTASSPPGGGHAHTRKKRLSLVPSLHAKIKIFSILEKSSSKTETFAIVHYPTRKPGSVSDILRMIVVSPLYPFHTLHCGEFSTQFPKTLFPKTKRLNQCVKFYNMRNSIKLFVENHIKGELHSNYIFLYFVLFGLEWDSVNLFRRMNFFFLPKLTFEHHLHKTYMTFYLLTWTYFNDVNGGRNILMLEP